MKIGFVNIWIAEERLGVRCTRIVGRGPGPRTGKRTHAAGSDRRPAKAGHRGLGEGEGLGHGEEQAARETTGERSPGAPGQGSEGHRKGARGEEQRGEGTYFPPFPFNHSIETEGLAKMAIENGNQPYGMPMLKIWHK